MFLLFMFCIFRFRRQSSFEFFGIFGKTKKIYYFCYMKLIGKVNGPITTPIAQSFLDPTGQDFIVAYKIERENMLSQIKEKMSAKFWISLEEYEQGCLSPFLTNYLFHILDLHRLYVSKYGRYLDGVKQIMSAFDDVDDSKADVYYDIMFQSCQETYKAIIRFYRQSINAWVLSQQVSSDQEPILDMSSRLLLTKQLLEKYEMYKDATVDEAVRVLKEQQGVDLSTKKATMLFWFLVYRIVTRANYTTANEKPLTPESFVNVLGSGKGISHNSLRQYDTDFSTRRNGAPGKIIIKEDLQYDANVIYESLRKRIINE